MTKSNAKREAFESAMSLADDIATGSISPADLDAVALAECRELFGTVAGPDDPLWELQVSIARQVLVVGGGWISADELAEWVAVYRTQEPQPVDGAAATEVVPPADTLSDEGDAPAVLDTEGCISDAILGAISDPTKPDTAVESEPARKRWIDNPRDEMAPPDGVPDFG